MGKNNTKKNKSKRWRRVEIIKKTIFKLKQPKTAK